MKLLSVARSLTAEVSCEGFYREGGAKNLLAEMIMHLLADPPLLAVGSIQESMLEKSRFGCVVDGQKKTPAFRSDLKSPDLHGDNRAVFRLGKGPRIGKLRRARRSRRQSFKITIASRENGDIAPDDVSLLPAKDPSLPRRSSDSLGVYHHFHQSDSACVQESAERLTLLRPHLSPRM